MTETTTLNEDFTSSARRFAEAVEALDEFRGQISALSEFKAQQKESAEALNGASVVLHAVVEALSPVGKIGAEILTALKEAVTAAEIIFDQETVMGIRSDITALGEEVRALRDGICSERDKAQAELGELQAKIAGLPVRVRQKHGF